MKRIGFGLGFLLVCSSLWALPEQGEVAEGRATFHSPDSHSLKITASDKAIINYKNFNIGEKERVQILQPSERSILLNRVKGKNPSKILGNLTANGRVFLVNPNGIYFGPKATVNAGSFLASTLDIRDDDFLNEKFHFFLEAGAEKGKIVNAGKISASPEGFVALLAPFIENRGSIIARAGKVVLAAAERVTLDFSGDGLIQFTIDGELKNALVENYGKIEAAGGAVELSMQTAKDAIKMVVNSDGVVLPNAMQEMEGGVIRLFNTSHIAADSVRVEGAGVEVGGEINASRVEKGGVVHLLGDRVKVAGAHIDASGDYGGGTVLIGGDFQGKGPVRNAFTTVVDEHTEIYCDARERGDGGRVIVWADDTAWYDGLIFARGGKCGGDGGFAETSGKENLNVTHGNVNTLSPQGKVGSWLMDPSSIAIARNNTNQGSAGLTTAATCSGGGFNLNDTTINNATSTVILCSAGVITQNNNAVVNITTAGVGITYGAASTPSNTTFQTGGVTTWNITTNGGPLTFNGPVTIPTGNTMNFNTSGGNVSFASTINGAGPLSISAGAGTTTFTGSVGATTALTSMSVTSATITQTSTAKTTGTITYTGSTAINLNNSVTTAGNLITMTGPVSLTNSVTMDSTNGGGSAAGADISFSSTVNGAQALTIRAGTGGNATLTGAVGGTNALTNLSFTSASTIVVGNNITVTGASSLIFPSPVTLSGTSTMTSNNALVSFSSTLNATNGTQGLTIAAGSGNVNFTNAVGNSSPLATLSATGATVAQGSTAKTAGALSYTGSTVINVGGNITTDGIITMTGPVSITSSPITIDSTNGGTTPAGKDMSFSSTLNGAVALTLRAGTAGIITFSGVVGGTTPPTNLIFTSAGQIKIGNNMTVSGANALTFPSPVLLTGTSTITSNNANVNFNSTINGAQALTIAGGTGTTTFSGAVGGLPGTPLTGLSATAAAINLNANVTTSGGAISMTGPVTTTATSLDTTNAGGTPAGANISFSSTVNGATALSLNGGTTGVVSLGGAVGGGTALTSLTATGATVTQSSTAKTTGALSYTGSSAINLNGGVTTGGGVVTMTGPVNLTSDLTVDSTNGGVVAAGANINFSSTINGAQVLTLRAGTSVIALTGAVGGTTALKNLAFTSGNSVQVGSNITVNGTNSLVFTIPVSLTGTSTITSNNANITFNALDGGQALTVAGGTGTTQFAGVVGTTPLASLSATAATITQSSTATTTGALSYTGSTAINLAGNVTTSGGVVTMTGPVILSGGPTIDTTNGGGTAGGAAISFSSTVNGSTALTLRAGTLGTSDITFTGAVGGANAPTNLVFTSGHSIRVGSNITVSGANPLVFSLPVSLTGTSTITSNNANITFNTTLDGAQALTIAGGLGTTTFTGAVGTTPLSSLSVTAATITQSSTAKTTGALTYTGSTAINVGGNITTSGGVVTMTGPVALTNAPTIDSTNGGGTAAGANISFSSTVNGATALTLRAGTGGTVSFTGAVGGTAPLTNLSFTSAGLIQIGNNITVTGANPLVFSSPVSLTGTSTITSNNANITFNTTLNGAQALTLAGGSGTTTFTGAVGGTTPLSSLSATAATVTQSSTAKTTGALSYTGSTVINVGGNITTSGGVVTMTGPVALSNTPTIDSTNGGGTAAGANISFSSTLNGGTTLSLNGGTAGVVTFTGAVGGTTPLTSLTATGATITQSSTAKTTGALSYTGSSAITVNGNITTSGGAIGMTGTVTTTATSFDTTNSGGTPAGANISFSSTLNGATTLSLNGGTGGAISFTGAVGGGTALTSLTATGATVTQSSTAKTTGALSYTGPSAITLNGGITTSGGVISLTGPVSLTASSLTIDSTNSGTIAAGANINFSSTLNGAVDLTLRAGSSGVISFGGAVGGITPLTSLTFASSSAIQIGGNITVTGPAALTFPTPVTLTGTSTITSNNANVTFSNTLNGAQSLTIAGGTGTTTFTGAIGGATPLASLSVTAANIVQSSTAKTTGALIYTGSTSISVNGNVTTSSGAITMAGPTTVAATSFDTTNGGSSPLGANISFTNTLNGAVALNLNGGTAGVVSLSNVVGGVTPLSSLTATGLTITQSSSVKTTGVVSYTGTTAVNVGGNITTSGNTITLTGPVNLSGNPTLDSTNGGTIGIGANISFSTTVNGATALTLRAGSGGNAVFNGAIGEVNALTNLSFTSANLIKLGNNVVVTGANSLVFPFPVQLTGGVNITSNGANISFSSTVNGDGALTRTLRFIAGAGSVTLTGAVGATFPLNTLAITSVNNLTANAITAGAISQLAGSGTTTFNGAVSTSNVLGIDLTGTAFTFNNTVTTTSGGGVSIVNSGLLSMPSGSNFTLDGPFSQTGSGSVQAGNTITSNNGILFTTPVALTSAASFSTAAASQQIQFLSTIDSLSTTPFDITLNAGTSSITISGNVGSTHALDDFLVQQTNNLTMQGLIANSATVSGGTGTTTINGNITIGAGGINVTGNNFVNNGNLVTTNGGSVTINNSGTATRSPGHTTVVDGNYSIIGTGPAFAGSSLTVKGNVLINPAVTLVSNAMIDTSGGGGNITFSSTVNGIHDLTVMSGTGNISFGGAVGNLVPIGALTVSSANNLTTQAITAASIAQTTGTGTTTFNGALTTSGAAGISVNTNVITRGAAITTTGGGPLTITNSGAFTSTAVGAITLGGAFTQNGAGSVSLGRTITTSNANISFASPITLASDTSLSTGSSAGSITLSQTVQGAFSLTLDSGAGNTTLSGAVGTLVTPLTGFTINRAADVSAQVITSAFISQVAGSGTTTFNGALNTTGASGISLTGAAFTFNNTFTTAAAGPLTLTNTGLATFSSAATGSVAGAVTQTGVGGVQLSSSITAGGAMQFSGPFTVSGTGTLSTAAANQPITFFSTLDGPGSLTLSAGTGDILMSGDAGGLSALGTLTISTVRNFTTQAVTASSLIQSAGTGTTLFNGPIATSGSGGINLTGSVITFLSNANAAGSGAITIANGGLLTTTPGTTLTGSGGFAQTGAGSVSLGCSVTTSDANISFAQPITLTSNVVLNSGTSTGDITVGTVDGNFDLTFTTGRDIFAGVIGGNVRLGTVKATTVRDNHASSITAGAIIQLAGTGTTSLVGDINTNTSTGINLVGTNFSRSGAIITTNGGSFVVTNSGSITGTSINTTSIDGSYTQIGVGPSATNNLAGTISARLGISLSSPISLISDPGNLTPIILDTSGGNGNIIVTGTINNNVQAPHTLILRSGAGDVTLSGSVGNTAPIGPLKFGDINDFTASAITAASIGQEVSTTLSGTAIFNGAVTTSGASGIVLTGNHFTFNNNVTTTGSGPVTITNSGTLAIPSGSAFSLDGAFTQSGTGSASLGGSITTTNDAISFAAPIMVTAPAVLNSGAGVGNITLSGLIDGASTLSLTAGTGNVSLQSAVGATTPLTALTIPSANTILASSSIFLAGPLTVTSATGSTTFNGTVNATAISLNGAAISFSLPVVTSSGAIALTNTGTLTIPTNAPFTSATSFTQTGAGGVSLGDNITTSGALSIASGITLTHATVLNSGGGNITLSNTVGGAFDMTLTAGSGNITLSGNVGTPRLGAFTITSANDISAQAITAASLNLQSATGTSTLHGSFDTNTATGITLVGNNFISSGTITTTNGGPLTVTNSGLVTATGPSTITLNGGGAFTQNGTGPVNVGGTITTQHGDILHTSPVSVLVPATFTSNGGDITFLNTVDGPACLTLAAGAGDVTLTAVVGGTTPLGCLAASGANIFQNTSVETSGTVQETGTTAIFVGGNITTNANDITLTGNVTTTATVTLSTGAGAGDILVTGTVNGNVSGRNLTMTAGTGDITLASAVGSATPYNNLTMSGANITWEGLGSTAFGSTGTTSLAATADITFTGTTYKAGTQIYTGGNNFDFTAGAPTTITSNALPITFSTGTIQLSTDLTIDSNGGAITFGDLRGATKNFTGDADTGAFNFVQIGASGQNLNNVTLTSNNFSPTPSLGVNVFANSLVVNSSTPQLISTNQTITNTTYNTPVIIQGNVLYSCGGGGGGTITFNRSVNAQTAGSDTLAFDFDPCTGSVIFNAPVGAVAPLASLSINAPTDVTFNSTVDVGSFAVTAGTGTTTAAAGMTTTAGDISISTADIALTGGFLASNGAIVLDNSGALTVAAGSTFESLNAFQQTGAGSVTIGGSVATHDHAIQFTGPVTLNGGLLLTSKDVTGGDISFASTIEGAQNLTLTAGSGDISFDDAVGTVLTPLAIFTINSAHDATASAPLYAFRILQLAGTGLTSFSTLNTTGLNGIALAGNAFNFNGDITTINGGRVLVNNGGLLTFANATYSISGPLTQSGIGVINLAGAFTVGGAVSFATDATLTATTSIDTSANGTNITFSGAIANDGGGAHNLTFNAGTGDITVAGTVGTIPLPIGALTLTSVDDASFIDITATSVTQSAGTGTTTLAGNIRTSGGSGIHLTGTNFTINSTVTTTNAGPFSITNTGPLSLTLGGGTSIAGSFTQSGGGAVSLAGTLLTSNQAISFANALSLTGATTLNSGSGAGNITLSSAVNGNQALTLTAGTGDISFGSTLGTTTPLGAVTVNSVKDVTYPQSLAASIVQAASSGTTTITGPFTTTGSLGVAITGGAINQNGAITALNTGPVSFTNSGTLTVGAGVNTVASGAYTQSGGGSVSLGGNITSNSGNVSLAGAVALTADVACMAGTARTLSFTSAITGAHTLDLTAVGGTITLGGDVGTLVTPLTGFTIHQAGNVSTQGVFAKSITQLVGTGSTTFNGALNATDTPGINLSGIAFTFNNTITTAVGGPLVLTNSGLATFNVGATGTITGAFTQNGSGTTQLSSAITAGGAISFVGALTASGTGSLSTQAANQPITFLSSVDGPGNLTLSSGTQDILFNIDAGASTRLGALNITTVRNLTMQSLTASSFTQSAGSNLTQFNGNINTNGSSGVSLTGTKFTFLGNVTTTGDGPVTLNNSGALLTTIGKTFSSNGIFTQNGSGTVSLGSTITTTNTTAAKAHINFSGTSAITLTAPASLNSSTGGGTITLSASSTVDGTQPLTLAAGTGDIDILGDIGGNTRIGAFTIVSAHDIEYQAVTASSISQLGASGSTSLLGALDTNTPAGMTFIGNTFTTGLFASSVTTTNGGNFTLTNQGVAMGLAPVTITIDGAFIQNGPGTIFVPSMTARLGISFTGPAIINTATTLDSSGGSGDIRFGNTVNGVAGTEDLVLNAGMGNVTFAEPVGASIALGSLTADGTVITVDDIGTSLAAGVSGTTALTASTEVVFSGTTYNANTQNYSVTTHFDMDAGALTTFTSSGSTMTFTGGGLLLSTGTDLTMNTGGSSLTLGTIHAQAGDGRALILNAGAGSIQTGALGTLGNGEFASAAFTGTNLTLSNTYANALTFTYSGTLNAAGNIVSVDTPLTFSNPVVLQGTNTFSTVGTTGAGVTFSSTLNGAVADTQGLTVNAGTGNVTFSDNVGVTTRLLSLTIGSANNVTLAAAKQIRADALIQSAGTGTTTFNGPVVVPGVIGILLTGNNFTFNSTVQTLNNASLTVTNSGTLTFAGTATLSGAFTQASSTGPVTLSGSITAGQPVSFAGPVTLSGTPTLNTSVANQTITFQNTLTGAGALTLAAGTGGDILFSANAGSPTSFLGAVLVNSSHNFTLPSLYAQSVHVVSSTGTGTVNGTLSTNGASGINLTVTNFRLNGGSATTGGGSFVITNSGLMSCAASATRTISGSYTQNGTGPVQFGGTLVTANGTISFASPVSILNPVTFNSSAGNQNITFSDMLDGPSSFSATAGGGNITFAEAIGSEVPLSTCTVTSAHDVSVNGVGTTAIGVTGTLSITATHNINILSDTHTAGAQIYSAGTQTNLEAGSLTTLTSFGGEIAFTSGIANLTSGNDLLVLTNNGDFSFVELLGSNAEAITIATGTGTAALNAVSSVGVITQMVTHAGKVTFAGDITADHLNFVSLSNIANASSLFSNAAPVITSPNTMFFNGLGGDVGSLSSPIEVQCGGQVFAGADPGLADFNGSTSDNTINPDLTNPPCIIIFNNVVIADCGVVPPSPSGGGGSVISVFSFPFAVPGFDSSSFNLASDYFFLPYFFDERYVRKEVAIYYRPSSLSHTSPASQPARTFVF